MTNQKEIQKIDGEMIRNYEELLIKKVDCLLHLLSEERINPETPTIGEKHSYLPAIESDITRGIIEKKLIELIKKF